LRTQKAFRSCERSVALGQISERYDEVVAIAGCHGKTTITSMLAIITQRQRLDATIHVGGYVEFLEGGVHVGNRDLFVTEACSMSRVF
jgi:UDP-N-acetylmuramate--alanine ligase